MEGDKEEIFFFCALCVLPSLFSRSGNQALNVYPKSHYSESADKAFVCHPAIGKSQANELFVANQILIISLLKLSENRLPYATTGPALL